MKQQQTRRRRERSYRRILRAVAEALENRLLLATFTVTNTHDSGAGSLRQAIVDSNATTGKDTIAFNLPSGSKTITVGTALPDLTDSVILDGQTQPSWSMTNQACLQGSGAAASGNGLRLTAGDNLVRGLTISGFTTGILLDRTSATVMPSIVQYNTVTGNAGVGIRNPISGDDLRSNRVYGNGGVGIDTATAGQNGAWSGPWVSYPRVYTDGEWYSDNRLHIRGQLTPQTAGNFTIDFYRNSKTEAGKYGVATTYLGSTTVNAPAALGTYAYDVLIPVAAPLGQWDVVAAQATGAGVGSSEIGQGQHVIDAVFPVVNVNDSGPGSLRQAVLDANTWGFAPNARIAFAIPGSTAANPAKIRIQSPLPLMPDIGPRYTFAPETGFEPLSTQIEPVASLTGTLDGLYASGARISAVRGLRLTGFRHAIVMDDTQTLGFVEDNLITGNSGDGIRITRNSGTSIRKNSIYNNGGLGIDLGGDGVTPNSPGAPSDSGPNHLQPYPVLTSAVGTGGQCTVSGTLTTAPNYGATIDFYAGDIADPTGYGEGKTWLGSFTARADASGVIGFAHTIAVTVPAGQYITATATWIGVDATSEFSRGVRSTGNEALVTTNNDSGLGSLRQAILNANAAPGTQTVYFQLPADQVTIRPLTPLPAVTDALLMDGTNLPGYSVTNRVTLDGSLLSGNVSGLSIQSSNSVVKGLAITGFQNAIVIDGSNNVVGGSTAATNLLFRNRGDGVRILSGTGNTVRYSRIVHNAGLAIDLGGDGATPNDPLDADTGTNTLLNRPVIASAYRYRQTVTVSGTYHGAPNQTFSIDLFLIPPSDDGQPITGRPDEFIRTLTVTTDSSGNAAFSTDVTLGSDNASYVFTACASDAAGNTSEFCSSIAITSAPFTVVSKADSGPGTLRQMILDANAAPGLNTIRFDLPTGGADPFTIRLDSALPPLTDSVVIDGTSQLNVTANGISLIAPTAGAGIDGIILGSGASGSFLKNLTLDGFRHGVIINCSSASIGIADGMLRITRSTGDGIRVLSGNSNSLRFARVSSAGGLRIDLAGDGPTANDLLDADAGPNDLANSPVLTAFRRYRTNPTVEGVLDAMPSTNYTLDFFLADTGAFLVSQAVTTDALGHAAFTAATSASYMSSIVAIATDSAGNTSEYSSPIATDFVPLIVTNTNDSGPGSLRDAITQANLLVGPDTIRFAIPGSGARRVNVLSQLPTISDTLNIDGTTQPGWAGKPLIELIGNRTFTGLDINPSPVTIRGLAIGGFDWGVRSQASGLTVTGCYIGIDAACQPAPNHTGISNWGENVTIGGSGAFEGNVISGNSYYGLSVFSVLGPGAILGNRIGVNPEGTAAIPNRIGMQGGGAFMVIGGTTAAARNIISGNTEAGLYLNANTHEDYHGSGSSLGPTTIQGNYIGTDVSGSYAIPNGIGIGNHSNTLIGGKIAAARNVIAGNLGDAVAHDWPDHSGSASLEMLGNFVGVAADGVTPMANGGNGLTVNWKNAIVGGTNAAEGNLIANNAGLGVVVHSNTDHRNGQTRGITIRGNSMYSNGGMGIDVNADGITPNDPGDTDTGPNDLQNFPVLTAASADATSTTLAGTLNSAAAKTFILDFYASSAADPSGYGEGRTYLGSTAVTTDGAGNASFSLTVPVSTSGQYITATATDASGNTSEFSLALFVPDVVPPQVQSITFDYACSTPRVFVRFSENVSPSLAAGDLVLQAAAGQGAAVPASSLEYDLSTNTAAFGLSAALTPGDYQALLGADDVSDPAGNALAAAASLNFFHLPGDANRDRSVDFADLTTVAQHYNESGAGYANGDLNGDGQVGFADLVLVAQNYNTSLPAPAAAPSTSAGGGDQAQSGTELAARNSAPALLVHSEPHPINPGPAPQTAPLSFASSARTQDAARLLPQPKQSKPPLGSSTANVPPRPAFWPAASHFSTIRIARRDELWA